MSHVYLDLNLFDKVKNAEAANTPQGAWYQFIYKQIVNEEIFVPYSNAHILELKRLYKKDKAAAEAYINTIKFISNDLCIINYWGDQGVTWLYRDVKEFFEASLYDSSFDQSFEEFFQNSEFKDDYELQAANLKLEKLPEDFTRDADNSPVLKFLFPKGYAELTQYALCEDVFCLSSILRKDHTTFAKIKSYVNDYKSRLKKQGKALKLLEGLETVPTSLHYEEGIEEYIDKELTADNPIYNNVTALYFKKNLERYRTDIDFPAMVDEAIHLYYASHCEYFLTNDIALAERASQIFRELKLKTKVMSAERYYKFFNL